MNLKELDGGLVALMEIHCREYRTQYGHLRTDGFGHMEPIPFPSRQMPTFFQLQAVTNKGLKLWLQMERMLYDHYEVPMDFRDRMEIRPRQMGKATQAGILTSLLDLALPTHPNPKYCPDVPARADIRPIDWDSILYGKSRPSVGPGGHADKEDINIIGKSGLFFGTDPGLGRYSRMRLHEHRHLFDLWPMRVDDDEPPEVKCSTDYNRKKGWKRIPLQIPNPAKPSPVLLALLKRSA
jgi:hypothetical protein